MKKTKPAGYELQPEHAEYFWRCLFGWQERLSLSDWRITRSTKEPTGRVLCEVRDFDHPQRQAAVRLKLNWFTQEPTEEALEQTAVHELLHIMLADLIEVAMTKGASIDDVRAAEHGIINRLEKLLVPGQEGT